MSASVADCNVQAWIDVASSNGAHHSNSLYTSYQSLPSNSNAACSSTSSSKPITKSSRHRLSSSKRKYQQAHHQHTNPLLINSNNNNISNTSMTVPNAKPSTDPHGHITNKKTSVEHEPIAQQQPPPRSSNALHAHQHEPTLSPSPLTHIPSAPHPPPPLLTCRLPSQRSNQHEAPSVDANHLYSCDSYAEHRDATPPIPEAISSDEKSPISDLTKLEYAIASCLDDINTFLDDYGNKSSLSYVVQKTINCRNEMVATLSVWRQYLDHPASTPKAVCLQPDDEDVLLSHHQDPNAVSPKPSLCHSAFAALNQGLYFDRNNYTKNGSQAPPIPCSAASSSLSLNQIRALSSLHSLHDIDDTLKHTALGMVAGILNSSTPAPIISDDCTADRNHSNNNNNNNNSSNHHMLSPLPPPLQEDKTSFNSHSFSSSPDVANSQEPNHRHALHSNNGPHKEPESASLRSPIDSNKNANNRNNNNVHSPLNPTTNNNASSKLSAYAQPYHSPFHHAMTANTNNGNMPPNVPPGVVNFSLNQRATLSPQQQSQQQPHQQQQASLSTTTANSNHEQQQQQSPLRSPTSPTRTYLMHYQFTPFAQNPSPAAYVEYYKNLAQYQSQQRTQSQSQTPLQQAQQPQQPPPQLLLQQQQQQQAQQQQRQSPHAMQSMLASMRPPTYPAFASSNGSSQNRTRSLLEEMMMSSPAFTAANNNNTVSSPPQSMMTAASYASNQYMAQLAAAANNVHTNGNQERFQQQHQPQPPSLSAQMQPANNHQSQVQTANQTANQNHQQTTQQMVRSPLMNGTVYANRPMVSEQKEMETDAFLVMEARENVRFAALDMSNTQKDAANHAHTKDIGIDEDDEIAQDQDNDRESSLYSEAKVGVDEELPDIADEPDNTSNFSSNYSSNRSNPKPQPQPPAPPQLPLPPKSKPPALVQNGKHSKVTANAAKDAQTNTATQSKPASKSPPLKVPNATKTNSSKPVMGSSSTPKASNSNSSKTMKVTATKPATKKAVSWSAICKKQIVPNGDHNNNSNHTVSRVKSLNHTDDEKSPELSMNDYHDVHAAFDNYRRQNGRVNTSSTTSSSHSSTTSSSNTNKDRITPSPSPPQDTHNKHIAAYDRFSQTNGAGAANHHHNNHHNGAGGKNASNGGKNQKCRVFVSNLPSTATDDQIRTAFSQCGDIANTVWFPSKTDGKFYGSGLITFSDGSGAREALKFNHQNVLGRIIRVEYSSCQDPVKIKPPGCRTIYLNNVPKDAKESGIRQIFKVCGRIKRVRFHERDTKRTGGAFIEFEHSSSCDRALDLHGILFDNHPLYVDYQRY